MQSAPRFHLFRLKTKLVGYVSHPASGIVPLYILSLVLAGFLNIESLQKGTHNYNFARYLAAKARINDFKN